MIDLSDVPKHTYLQESHDHWQSSMYTITEKGGPWYCDVCETASLLSYRCSCCGAELHGSGTTAGRENR
jgi:hypothetical protein